MRTVAEALGLTKASLFHHVGSKDELYDEIFASLIHELAQLLPQAAATADDFPAQLDALGTLVTRYLGTQPAAARLLIRELLGGAVAEHPMRASVTATLEATTAFLADGIARTGLPEQDPRHLALSIIGLHLTWFAAAEVSGALIGGDVYDEAMVEARVAAVLPQVRRMVGLPAA